MIDATNNSYVNSSIQYSITKPSISVSATKSIQPSTVSETKSAQSASRVYVTKEFSHQKVEYVRKQNKNTL